MINTRNAIGKMLGKPVRDLKSKNSKFRVGVRVVEKDTGKKGKVTETSYGSGPEGADNTWVVVKYDDGSTYRGLGIYYWDVI